jgi:SAM-dependent methyltransferase
MLGRNSDDEWKKYGAEDPYYGVVSLDKFHRDNLTPEALDEFFESGRRHIAYVLETVRRHVAPDFRITGDALDFGCGVGRCLIPMATLCKTAVGVDVSEAMLDAARRHAAERSVDNLRLVTSDDALSNLTGPFDFVHSFAVFQHIPPRRGEKLVARLLGMLAEGGVASIQFVYDRRVSAPVKLAGRLRRWVPLLHPLLNVLSGEKASKPLMEKNCYNLNRLVALFRAAGCPSVHVAFEGKGRIQSLIVCGQKLSHADVYDYEAFFAG